MRISSLSAALVVGLFQALVVGAEYKASSAAEMAALTLKAGDAVVLSDGTWTDQRIILSAVGTPDNPITFRAQTPGKVILSGDSSLAISGQHLVVSGLHLKAGKGKDAIAISGSHCRLTECAITGGEYKFFVHVIGAENRVDHCYLADKTSADPTMQIEAPANAPNNGRIDHNHFGPRPPLGKNGGETIRVGYSGQSMNNSRTIVESNLFDRCDGELEIISSKSCENVYRWNTFLDCAGMFTLRHGNRCVVDANFFIGHHKKGSGGIRVIGEDHRITNNYIDGVAQGAFWITSGVPDSALNQYFQAKGCVIAFNTVVDSPGVCLDLSAGLGAAGRTLKPEKITVANNIFSLPEGGKLFKGTEGERWEWRGNLAAGGDHAGVKVVDLKLARGDDKLWRPAEGSPAIGSGEGDSLGVKLDIDGQPRPEKPDVGCDQRSAAPITSRPLTAGDVGPSWLARTAGEPAH